MKKWELLGRIQGLESRQKEIKEDIQSIRDDAKKIKDDLFPRKSFLGGYHINDIPTRTKINKILEYLGIEIYETTSEIKVRSTKPKKKKGKK